MHRAHTNACGRVLLTEQPPQTICGATHQRECTQSRMKMQKVKSLFKEYAIFIRALNKSLQRVHTAFAQTYEEGVPYISVAIYSVACAESAVRSPDVKGQPSLKNTENQGQA